MEGVSTCPRQTAIPGPGHGPGTLVNLASEIGCSLPKLAVAAS